MFISKKILLSVFLVGVLVFLPTSSSAREVRREAGIQVQEMPSVAPLPLSEIERDNNEEASVNEEMNTETEFGIQIQSNERARSFSEIKEQRTQEIMQERVQTEHRVQELRNEAMIQVEQKREEFREKVQSFSNEALRLRTEVLARNIERVNENLSQRYGGYLDALELILDKLETLDSFSEYDEVAEARVFISQARERIMEQRAKAYIVDLGPEETLRDDFQRTMNEMRRDHRQIMEEYISPLRSLIRNIMTK